MMFKRHVLKELSAYLDNQLSQTRKLEIERHIEDCEICSRELSRLRLLSERLKAWQAPNPEAGFDSSLRNEIVSWELQRGEVKMKKKTLAILIPSSALAGILLIVFLGGLYMRMGMQGRLRVAEDGIGGEYYESSGEVAKSYASARLSSTLPYTANWTTSYTDDSEAKAFGGALLEDSSIAYRYAYPVNGIRAQFSTPATKQGVLVRGAGAMIEGHQKPAEIYSEGSVIVIQPTLPATGEGERIIRTAQVALEVEDGNEAYKKASEICKELGGYLAASNFYKDAEGREAGTITMRIPKDKFITALDRLRGLGKVENINTNSQDVSQEYANLKSRLDATMVVYGKMLEALQKRQTTIPEAMRLESELTPVLQRIEELKNQIEYLNNAVSFTTITVNFREPEVSAKILKESKRFIQQSLLATAVSAVRFFARAIPVIVILTLWFVVVLGVVIALKYWIIRLFKRR